ncbi:hypothetical protein EI693_17875 [Pseudomonas oryziphila]|uniref:Uncharacterized protein n=1 Tax=Pseudomonas oryziphila TaxID=2894079 RepID=A0ABM7CYB0_9PSED|nr:hypothetical protein EI693_17875 [Pseudomonas oryziphila]
MGVRGELEVWFWLLDLGAAAQPFRDTRPLLQEHAITCRSGLASRKGRKAPPALSAETRITYQI